MHVTRRKYREMLEVLPTAAMASNKEYEGFLVGEPTSHNDRGEALYASYFCDAPGNMSGPEYIAGPNMTVAEFKKCIAGIDWETLTADVETPDDVALELELIENYGEDTVREYLADGNDLDSFEDRYCGQYASNKEFAMEMAESTGALDNDQEWPFTCIDWEWAARELMYDYTEYNGHYFNNY